MKKRNIKIISIALVVVVIVFLVYYKMQIANGVVAETYKVGRGEISEYVEETGTVKSRGERIIYSNTAGEVKNIEVDEGDSVKKEAVLVQMDSDKTDLEIKSLDAQIQGLKATYKEAIKPVDKQKIDKAEAKVETAKANLDEAKRDLKNSKKLYENGAIALDDYKAAQNNLVLQENVLKIAENDLTLLKKGVSGNIRNQYEAQIAELVYQKEILEKTKGDLIITAPADGIVTEIFVKEGAYVQPGTDILEIGNIKELYVEVDVLASEVGDIKEGGLAIIYSDDLGINELKGTVEKIYPKAFSKVSDLGIEQKRVRIDISIPQSSKLKMGYDVDSKFQLWSKNDTLIVPDNTIFDFEDGKYVFVVENGKAALREVETGLEGEDFIEIKSGLKEGEKVIVSPDEDIKEGINVKEEEE